MTDWHVYLLKCADGTLYCGATGHLNRRIKQHNAGKASKYTRGRLPVTLVVFKGGLTKQRALKLEAKVKKQPKDKKVEFLKKRLWEE
jgi:putative endonuclease